MGSRLPRIEHTNSHTLKVGYVPGRNRQTVHERGSCDEGITIRARIRRVKHTFKTSLDQEVGETSQHEGSRPDKVYVNPRPPQEIHAELLENQ
jgi:hypothetical protein